MQKKIGGSVWISFSLILVGLVVLASCSETDIVAQHAVSSFDALVQKLGPKVSDEAMEAAWLITSPGDDRFMMAKDFSRANNDGESPDFEFDFDAQPFIAAGLDINKLPSNQALTYRLEDGRLMLHFDWGQSTWAQSNTDASPSAGILATFKQVLLNYRERISYHEKLDHYGVALGDGNMLEWAKDLSTNDKDLVFILNPEPLIKAGVDPNYITGWLYAKVEIKNEAGQAILVDKLLKPFSLE